MKIHIQDWERRFSIRKKVVILALTLSLIRNAFDNKKAIKQCNHSAEFHLFYTIKWPE